MCRYIFHKYIHYLTFLLQFFKCEDADNEYEFPDDYSVTPEMLEELLEFEMRATVTLPSGMSHLKVLRLQLTDSTSQGVNNQSKYHSI